MTKEIANKVGSDLKNLHTLFHTIRENVGMLTRDPDSNTLNNVRKRSGLDIRESMFLIKHDADKLFRELRELVNVHYILEMESNFPERRGKWREMLAKNLIVSAIKDLRENHGSHLSLEEAKGVIDYYKTNPF